MRKRNTKLDYRLYHVEPPRDERRVWIGVALLYGLPDVEAHSEGDLRDQIDEVYRSRSETRSLRVQL